MKKVFFLSTIFNLFLAAAAFAQGQWKGYGEILKACDAVVEGQILSKVCEMDSISGNLYTLNRVKVVRRIQGEVGESLLIRTEGGSLGGYNQLVSHSIQFNEGEEGIFLLSRSTEKKGIYKIADGGEKIVKVQFDRAKEGFDFIQNTPIASWSDFRQNLEKALGEISSKAIVDNSVDFSNQSGLEICYLLKNLVIDFEAKSIRFDIFAKSSVAGVKFSDASLNIEYPTGIFGSNVVQNSNIQVEKKTIASNAIYGLAIQDLAQNKFSLQIGANCENYANSYALSLEYENLAQVTLNVQNWVGLLNWQTESIQATGAAKYFEDQSRCADFQSICFEHRLVFTTCDITDIEVSPFAAGILQTITFNGSGFGGSLGQNPLAKIVIPNAHQGGNTNIVLSGADQDYVVNWQDNEVEIKISSGVFGSDEQTMGSGKWQICPNFGASTEFCEIDVDIDYALVNTPANGIEKMVSLAQKVFEPLVPDDGAFEWYLDDGIDADPVLQAKNITFAKVENVAIQAFCDWEVATGLEFRYMGALHNANNGNDSKNALYFGNPGGGTGAKTTTSFTTSTCPDDDVYFRGYHLEFDMNIDKQANWYVSTGTSIANNQVDMYSVISHEIGHALLMKHSMDLDPTNLTEDDRMMYWALTNGQIKRVLDAKTTSGIELLKERTLESIFDDPDGCFFPVDGNGNKIFDLNFYPVGCMTPTHELTSFDCQISTSTIKKIGEPIEILLEGLESMEVVLVNSTGRIESHSNNQVGQTLIPTNNLSPGVYFLQYMCNDIPHIKKVVLY